MPTGSPNRKDWGRSVPVKRIGLRRHRQRDLYHWLLCGSWLRLLISISVIYFGTAFIDAMLFLAAPGAIENARDYSMVDAVNFSIQTLSTIGYVTLGPATGYGHFLVATEMLMSLLLTAVPPAWCSPNLLDPQLDCYSVRSQSSSVRVISNC